MCQLLNPFSCHPPFLLTHLSLSHHSNTKLKLLLTSWDSYCWAVVCGRTVSPCPHAHSTSGLSLHVGKEANNSILPFLHFFFPSKHKDGRSLLLTHRLGFCIILLTHRLGFFIISSCSKLGSRFLPSTIFPVKAPFTISVVGVCFHTNFVVWVYVFPAQDETLITSSISGCVFPLFQCWDWGYCFPHDLWFDVGSFLFWVCCGYYWDVLATIGPRMTQESYFPAQAVNRLFCCVYAVVGLWTMLAWLICWWPDKPNYVDLLIYVFLAVGKPARSLFLGKSCLAWGWQCCWEIKEHTGLWLGGTL